ncbi:MAG: SDR family NAD(P)-dependent oxidoreductase [Bacilli bacterium]|nr:SDR family NAD(P)-dependent oxidoreductase [Bacilli bacterium]
MRCVLIIGGNSDIGISLANYFISKDYNVVIGYHNDNNKYIDSVKYIKCDVTDTDSIEKIILDTKNMYGNIDIIINLACISMDNSFLNKTKEEFMKVLEVNLVGTFLCNQIYSRYIDDGLIINIASTDGVDTYSEYSIDYSASKSGVINISKSVSLCTKNKILCIAPNWIDSNSTRCMNKEYLESELKRIKQDRLITMDEFILGFDKIINSKFNSGDIFRIDIKDGELWVEKI